jgi:alpha-L-rhamnosidase
MDSWPPPSKTESFRTAYCPWPFTPLQSRARVRVRVRSTDGAWTEPSAWTALEIGLLQREDWCSVPVSPPQTLTETAPLIVRDIPLTTAPVRARLYATAWGLYDLRINGNAVGDQVLAPGWTAYDHRLRYQTYDVTALLSPGRNRVEAVLGNGWYRGQLVWPGNRNVYGDRLALQAQLELFYADGTVDVVATDATWSAGRSSIVFDDLYDGQHQDLRIQDRGPDPVGVEILDALRPELVAPEGPPVRVTEVRRAQRIITTPSGRLIADFGQNLVGWVRIRASGAAGDQVTVRHAEVLEGGELGVRPLRSAKATCSYALSGGQDVLQPTITFNGFRYAEIDGIPGIDIADVEALVIGSDIERTSWLTVSDPDVQQLHENIVWSMRGNFLDVPTDCPQRDERLGWTGDIQLFAPAASTLYDCSGFLSSWLRDLAAEQHEDGGMPYVIPDVLRGAIIPGDAAAGWGDAAAVVPMTLYERFADLELLARQYPSMRAWVNKVESVAGPGCLWTDGYQFGDWLDPTAPPEDASLSQADPSVVATAYFFRSTQLVGRAARLLGLHDDADLLDNLTERIRAAFTEAYVGPDGAALSDCQTVYALALAWGLITEDHIRRLAGDRLAALVHDAHHRVSTGFLGTPVVLDALCDTGHEEVALSMLLERGMPSWLYPVTMGRPPSGNAGIRCSPTDRSTRDP